MVFVVDFDNETKLFVNSLVCLVEHGSILANGWFGKFLENKLNEIAIYGMDKLAVE